MMDCSPWLLRGGLPKSKASCNRKWRKHCWDRELRASKDQELKPYRGRVNHSLVEQWTKDPDAIEWIPVPWKRRLGTVTIATVDFQIPAGLTKVAESNTDDIASVRLSGGTLGKVYSVVCRITTSDSQTLDYSFNAEIRQE